MVTAQHEKHTANYNMLRRDKAEPCFTWKHV